MAETSDGKKTRSATYKCLPQSFQYSPSLNSIFSISEKSGIEVLDVHSGNITTCSLADHSIGTNVQCKFFEDEEKLLVISGRKIGIRSTNGEHIFLNTILQVADVPEDGKVIIELDIVKAGLLLNELERCLKLTSFSSTPGITSASHKEQFQEVTTTLKNSYENAVLKMKDVSGRGINWLTVDVTLEHSLMMNVFNTALLLCKQDKRGPALPVIGDILQRLTCMQKTTFESVSSEKRLMFNEVDRLQTFNSWPHMNYKWALPGAMAEAGFYHPQASKSAEDRAMCFTCSVCLVCWESSDQPWSEHKRHSANCPFVKGDYTENVPLQVYSATAGAEQIPRATDKFTCVSSTCCGNLVATGTEEGYIVIWEIYPMLKIHSEYQLSISAIKDSSKKKSIPVNQQNAIKKPVTLNGPDTLKELAADIANDVQAGLESPSEDILNQSTPKKTDATTKLSVQSEPLPVDGNNKITDVEFEGESYCVISDLPESKTENPLKPQDNVFSIEDSISLNLDDSITDNEKSVTLQAESSTSNDATTNQNECKVDSPADIKINAEKVKSESKTSERSCQITSVTIMKDKKNGDQFIVAGVKIESKKIRNNKERVKRKLSLLIYKLAGKIKTKSEGNSMTTTLNNPFLANPFGPIGSGYEDEFSMGSDDDYYVFDENDPAHLSVIDEYLLAAGKHPETNGGTQNIGPTSNEIKAGFDQEEVIRIDDTKTVYEDCAFHKFDIDRKFYNKGMYVSDLLVVDGCLVTILKKEKSFIHSERDKVNMLLIGSVSITSKKVIGIQLLAHKKFTGNSIINDVITVSCQKLPTNLLTNLAALHQFENMEKNPKDQSIAPAELLVLAHADNTLSFLTIPKLTSLKFVADIPTDSSIHKITYCNTLSSIMVCDTNGCVTHCPCTSSQDEQFDGSVTDLTKPTVNQWKSPLSLQDLQLLSELTKFEPATQSCYIFFPVNWYVARSTGSANKTLKNSPVPSHMLKLSPVEMDKRLMKRSEQLDIELSKSDFTFRMFVLVQTAIGYFDILVNLKSILKENEDFTCSIYVDESRTNGNQGQPENENKKLISGPVLFSSVMDSKQLSGQFTICVPDLLHHKSLYVIVKLEHVLRPVISEDSSSVIHSNAEATVEDKNDVKDVMMSDILKDVYVGVYQFKNLAINSFYYPGCRSVLVKDVTFMENLLNQYLELISNNGDLRDGFEVKLILETFVWVTNIYLCSNSKDSFPLIQLIEKNAKKFLIASLYHGDRAICHYSCVILLGLKMCTESKTFSSVIISALMDLLPFIHNANSPTSCQWLFWLISEFIDPTNPESLEYLKHLTSHIMTVGKEYAERFTDSQKILDARYGMTDMIFEPVITEPLYFKYKCGTTITPGGSKAFDIIKIPTSYFPGILEEQPLHFFCISTSEGSKVEFFTAESSLPKTNKGAPVAGNMYPLAPPNVDFPYLGGPQPQQNINSTDTAKENITPLDTVNNMMSQSDWFSQADALYLPFTENLNGGNQKSQKHSATKSMPAANDDCAFVEDSIVPKPMCMIVDKMHVYSVHYAILQFKTPVLLTDVIIPPCKSLASITISIWNNDKTTDDIILAHSDEIGRNALVFSCIFPPIEVQRIKVLVVGGDSCSTVIPLGQYFGHIKQELANPSQNLEKYRQQYDDLFCRYSLAAERVKPFPVRLESATTKFSKSFGVVLSTMKRDYALCSHLQLCMMFLHNSLPETCANNLLRENNLEDIHSTASTIKTRSFSLQQLLLNNLLRCILVHLTNMQANDSSLIDDVDVLTREDFILLFKCICLYGSTSITDTAILVLHLLCHKKTWWSSALVEVFQYCFYGVTANIVLPRKRLFNTLMKLIVQTKDLNSTAHKFFDLLRDQLTIHKSKGNNGQDGWAAMGMLVSILLALNEILQVKDNAWLFFSPWEILPTDLPNVGSIGAFPPNTSRWNAESPLKPKLVSTSGIWYPPDENKNKNNSGNNNNNNKMKNEKETIDLNQLVIVQKSDAVPVVKALLDFFISKLKIGNTEQMILICKVCSLIIMNCESLILLEDLLTSEKLDELLAFCLSTTSNKWLVVAINLLLRTFVEQKNKLMKMLTMKETEKPSASVDLNVNEPLTTEQIKQKVIEKKAEMAPKIDQLKKMHEAIMSKKFYEATEGTGHKSGFFLKSESLAAVDKEINSSISAKDCAITHVVHNRFGHTLEESIHKIQRKFQACTTSILNHNTSNKQIPVVDDTDKLITEIIFMQSSTISYMLSVFIRLCRKNLQTTEFTTTMLEQLLFFMNLYQDNKCDIDRSIESEISTLVLDAIKNKKKKDISVHSLLKQLTDGLVKMPEIGSSFSMQLLFTQRNHGNTNHNEDLDDFTLISLKQLMSKPTLLPPERQMLKQFLYTHISNRNFNEGISLLPILKELYKSDIFSLWDGDEEIQLSIQLIETIALKVKEFIQSSAVLIQAAQQERSDTKRTVFVLHEGNVRLAGKAHQLEDDVKECLALLDIMQAIFLSNVFQSNMNTAIGETFTCLLECLCCTGHLVNHSKFLDYIPLGLPLEVENRNLHPLATSVLHTLLSVSKCNYWPQLVDGLIMILKKQTHDQQTTSSYDGLKIFMKIFLARSNDIWIDFINKGGFEIIYRSVIHHSTFNLNWTDTRKHSPTIHDLFSSQMALTTKKTVNKDRIRKDVDGVILENYAPYAKISGPSSSPAADVLLVNKSPLRRSRFAAWAHQFQESDSPWIQLEITFPFEIMLKEIVIYMHGNYLMGAPSETIVEIKGLSNSFSAVSPTLHTGGLQSIVLNFAEGQICKELRFRLKRPNGADHIKLNLIEFYGRSVFASSEDEMAENPLPIELWCDTLSQLFTNLPQSIAILNKCEDSQDIITALLSAMPFLSRSCLLRLSTTFVLNLLPSIPDLAFQVTTYLTNHVSNLYYLTCLNNVQLQLLIQLLADMIKKSTEVQRIRIFVYLFDWLSTYLEYFLQDENTAVIEVFQNFTVKVFPLIQDFLSDDFPRIQVSKDLIRILQELLLQHDTLPITSFIHLCRFINYLVILQPELSDHYLHAANKKLQHLLTNPEDAQRVTLQTLTVPVYCYTDNNAELRSKCFRYFDQLAVQLCTLLETITSRNIGEIRRTELKQIDYILTVFRAFSKNIFHVSSWFSTDTGRLFWKPLIQLITMNEMMKSEPIEMYEIQHVTLSMFHDVLYLQPDNQEYFSHLLIQVLTENRKKNQFMNGYMKLLVLQLIIAEDTIVIKFKSKSNTYVLQNTQRINVRITATLNEIEATLMKIKHQLNNNVSIKNSDEKNSQTSSSQTGVGVISGTTDFPGYLSNVAGQMAVLKRKQKSKDVKTDRSSLSNSVERMNMEFYLSSISDQPLPKNTQFGQILQRLFEKEPTLLNKPPLIEYNITSGKKTKQNSVKETTPMDSCNNITKSSSLPSMLEIFAKHGGLSFLTCQQPQENSCEAGSTRYLQLFSMILPLPGFSKVFLKYRVKAEYLLRLMLGINETKSGQKIQQLSVGDDLLVLPLKSLCNLFQDTDSTTLIGNILRQEALERQVILHILQNLNYLANGKEKKEETSQQQKSSSAAGIQHGAAGFGIAASHQENNNAKSGIGSTTTPDGNYWAKGTGFGTGSTVSSWDIEKAMKDKKKEEEHIVVILQTLAAFINSKEQSDNLPNILQTSLEYLTEGHTAAVIDKEWEKIMEVLEELLSKYGVTTILANYLRNDSVLDMSRHIPLYHSVMSVLRSFACSLSLIPLLISMKGQNLENVDGSSVLLRLLSKLKTCVETYQNRLKVTNKTKTKLEKQKQQISNTSNFGQQTTTSNLLVGGSKIEEIVCENESVEQLNLLLTDIHTTTAYVLHCVNQFEKSLNETTVFDNDVTDNQQMTSSGELSCSADGQQNDEERYINEMEELQFDTYEIVTEKDDGTIQFNVPYHYANSVLAAAKNADTINAARSRRLAQEVASLSTSLPLSYSSTVFLQCDEERLDVMKVLITGPEDTPYENGCFEFDIYFPHDYPSSPMSVNLQTTGKHTVRFNPNLYNDGKVCLSILNTWHGRPEERWNAQTSNLLQVLVSIQSLILVSEPYFNEPGYERLRGTPQGKQNCNEYNANIEQATVKWAILEQIKRPSNCFKEIIHKHFLRKKSKITSQCERWLKELKSQASKRKSTAHSYEALKNHYAELKIELQKLEQKEENTIKDDTLTVDSSNDDEGSSDNSKNVETQQHTVVENKIETNKTSSENPNEETYSMSEAVYL